MDRLSLVTLPALGEAATRPAFDPRALGIGIVHLGIGAFHRAHQAIYTDEALTAGDGDWGICGVSLRSPDMRERMRVQDGLYTAVEKSSSAVHRRIVGSVREVLYLAEDRTAVAARLAAGATRIVCPSPPISREKTFSTPQNRRVPVGSSGLKGKGTVPKSYEISELSPMGDFSRCSLEFTA